MNKPRIYVMTFAKVYPMYVEKAAKKGRTETEVRQIITWLTGYDDAGIDTQITLNNTFEDFFNEAPHLNPNADLITGVVCKIRVEDIEDPMTQKIRYLDKLIDELAKGKKMEKILRV